MNELISNIIIFFRVAIVFPLIAFLIHQWRLRKFNGHVKIIRNITTILTLSILLLDIMLIVFRFAQRDNQQFLSSWFTIPMLAVTVFMYCSLWYAYKRFKEIQGEK